MQIQPQTKALWDDPKPTALLGAGGRHRARRLRLRRDRPCRRRSVLQHRHDRLSRKSSPIRPMPGRSSPSRFPISAMSAPTRRTSRPSTSRRRPARAASCCIPRSRNRRTTAPRRHLDAWLKSRGVIGLAGLDTRALTALIREQGHAERRNRARAVRPLRSRRAQARGKRVAGPRRHGSRADGDDGSAFHLGRDAVAMGRRLRPAGSRPNFTSSPSITASSATFCASSPAMPAR